MSSVTVSRSSNDPSIAALIEALPLGCAVWNGDDRLVAVNDVMIDIMRHLSAGDDTVGRDGAADWQPYRIGETFRESLERMAAEGMVPVVARSRTAEWIEDRVQWRRMKPSAPVRQLSKDGRWYEYKQIVTSAGWVLDLRIDVNARFTAEQGRMAAIDHLYEIIDAAPAVILVTDRKNRILMANAAFGDMVGRDPATLTDELVIDVVDRMTAQHLMVSGGPGSAEIETELSLPDRSRPGRWRQWILVRKEVGGGAMPGEPRS